MMDYANLEVRTGQVIPNHPANSAGQSWKYLVIAGNSLSALEGMFHRRKPYRDEMKSRSMLHRAIMENLATDCVEVREHCDLPVDAVGWPDFIDLAIDRYDASPRLAQNVAERLFGVWEFWHGLTEVEQWELDSWL